MKAFLSLALARYRTPLLCLLLTVACLGFARPSQAATCSITPGGSVSSSSPYSQDVSLNPNPRPTIVSDAPLSAATYTYVYNVNAYVLDSNNNIVASDNVRSNASGSFTL